MPKPPSTVISLSEARRRVCEAHDCSQDEAEEYLGREIRFGSLELVGAGGRPVALHGDTVINFENSSISRTRRLQTRAIMDDGDRGKWETVPETDSVMVRRADLEALIRGGQAENAGTNSARGAAQEGTIRAETRCKAWLRELSQPDKPVRPKESCRAGAQQRFPTLSKRGFYRAWDAVMPSDWKKPGRRPNLPQ